MSNHRQSVSRRTYLTLVGSGLSGLAGCGAEEGDNATPTQTPTDTPTPTQPSTAHPEETTTNEPTAETTTTDGANIGALERDVSDLSFDGELFDTHAHWAGARDAGHARLDPETFASRMDANDVGGCVLFTSSVDVVQRYPSVLQQLATDEVDYLPFLQPHSRAHLMDGEVTNVYSDHPVAFMGVGEIIFYGGPMRGTSLTADPWPKLFQFAADNDVPLMIHPTQEQEDGLATMLSKNPGATVMAHGGEFNLSPDKLASLLRDHDNLYWTIDAGSMLNGLVLTASDASEFVDQYDQQRDEFEQLVEQVLPPVMDAAADRVMWGTDLATDWNTDEAVYSRIMDWTERAIETLPPDQQDKYAYENAKVLFGL